MGRLIHQGETRRLGRTGDIHLTRVGYDGNRLWAYVQGSGGDMYNTRITQRPQPNHKCTCADWVQNGQRVGPCKHVLRLAEVWMDVVVAKLER